MVIFEPEDAFEAARDMLLASGLWPLENKTWRYKLKTIISWMGILGLCLTMWLEFFNDLHDLVKLSGISYILIAYMNGIIKQIGFTANHKTLQETLRNLKDPVFTSHSEELNHHMVDTVKFSVRFGNTFKVLIVTFVILLSIFPIIENKPLPFPFPYDLGKYQFLMYAFQICCEFISAWNHVCLDFICISLLRFGSAQLDILADKIVQIQVISEFHEDHKKRDENVIKQLKHCVDHHLAIIRLIENIEQIFSVGILAQYLASSLIVCIVIFSFILIPPSLQFVILVEYFISVMIRLFVYCWFGNEILNKSLQVGDACYTFNWYDYGLPVRKYLFLMMERAKRPSCITALKFTSISIESLTTVLQWSYSMLTLLLNVYKQDAVEN